jgi:hypothetical protein
VLTVDSTTMWAIANAYRWAFAAYGSDAQRARGTLRRVDSSTLVAVTAVFLVYATVSRRLRGTPITAPIVFVGAGFLFGPEGFGSIHLTLDEAAVSSLTEMTLVVVLFSASPPGL